MKQLTVRGFDPELERRLRELAATRGTSLNRAALLLMRRGAGLAPGPVQAGAVGPALDRFIGGWSLDEEAELLDTVEAFERIDPDLWS